MEQVQAVVEDSPMAVELQTPPVAPLDNNLDLGPSRSDGLDRDPESPLRQKFPAKRDGDAWLFEPTHTYVVRGTEVHTSVTKIIKKHWPQFDPDVAMSGYQQWKANKSSKYGMLIDYLTVVEQRDDDYCKAAIKALWRRKGEIASKLGTDMHRDFQYICEDKEPPQGETYEVQLFRPWLKTFCEKYKLAPWRAEWVVYYEVNGRIVVAGQIDLVLKHTERDEYWCIDYKRKDPTAKYPGGGKQILGSESGSKFREETGSGPFKEMPYNDFSVYTTQLNAYGHIAATQYGVDFRDRMCLLQIHPFLETPHLVRCERLDDAMVGLFALEAAALPKPGSAAELF